MVFSFILILILTNINQIKSTDIAKAQTTTSVSLPTSGRISQPEAPIGNIVTVGFNNEDYVCDGIDDHVQFNQATAYLRSKGGGTIVYSAGTYDVDGDVTCYSNIDHKGAGIDQTVFRMGLGDQFEFDSSNLYNNPKYSLSVDVGTTAIPSTGLSAGDIVKIEDDEFVYRKNSKHYAGEINEVSSISGSTAYLKHPLGLDYHNNGEYQKLNVVENIKMEDFTMIGQGRESDGQGIYFKGGSNIVFNRIKVKLFGYAGIAITDSINVRFTNSFWEDIYKKGLGYGVVLGNAVDQILFDNCDFSVYGRHYIASGASGSMAGWGKGIRVQNSRFQDCGGDNINMHRQSIGPLEVVNCEFINTGKAVETLNAHTLIEGCTFINVPTLFDLGHWSSDTSMVPMQLDKHERQHVVRNNVAIGGGQAKINSHNFLMENNDFDGYYFRFNHDLSERSVMDPLTNIQIHGNTFRNIGTALDFNNYVDYVHIINNDGDTYSFESKGSHVYINVDPPTPFPQIITPLY
jgi:hypothetical protein